jgi:hypothetical protein
MALVVPNEGEIELLKKLLINTADTESYSLRLFKNDYTPDQSTSLGNFTEADFTNYALKTLARSDWGTPTMDANNKAQSQISVQSWTCGLTGNTVYGYYVVGATSGKVLWAERFNVSRSLGDGDVLNVTPVFNLSSAN